MNRVNFKEGIHFPTSSGLLHLVEENEKVMRVFKKLSKIFRLSIT